MGSGLRVLNSRVAKWSFAVFGLCLLWQTAGCVVSPSPALVQRANVEWADLKAIDGCPPAYRYRVLVDEHHKITNRSALELEVVEAAGIVAAREWVKEVKENSRNLGCGSGGLSNRGSPVLSVTLKSIQIHGGGIKGMMYLAAFPYVVPMWTYASWDNEYTVTVGAELEFRHAGKILWTAEVYEQKTTERDMYDASSIVYDGTYGEVGMPLRVALELLRNKVFLFTVRMNEQLRGRS